MANSSPGQNTPGSLTSPASTVFGVIGRSYEEAFYTLEEVDIVKDRLIGKFMTTVIDQPLRQ